MAQAARELPPMMPDDEYEEVADKDIIEEIDMNDKRIVKPEDLADVGQFHEKSELKRKLRKGVEKARKQREGLPETADEAIEGVISMHEDDVMREESDKELKKWEAGQAEKEAGVEWESLSTKGGTIEDQIKRDEKAARDASREAFKKRMSDDARQAAEKAAAVREEIEWEGREREASRLLGEEGMEKIEGEIAHAEAEREAGKILDRDPELKGRIKSAIEKRGAEPSRLPEGENRELRAELNVQIEELGLFEKEWKAAREKLETMKIDVDKPRGIFGRVGLGLKKMFNRDLKRLHDEYAAKVDAWRKADERITEIKAALGVDEGPGATRRHGPKVQRDGKLPTGKTSIRGEM